MQLTNTTNLPISLAVWLATDDYDHSDDPNEISATTLNKSIRQIVLARQNNELEKVGDVMSLLASRMGTAYHAAIESSWVNKNNLQKAMTILGYPAKLIDRIVINPEPEDITEDMIPVYMEIRKRKKIAGFTVSGKFDFVIEGTLEDFKSTSTYSYLFGSNVQKYIQQGSIYRWLNPEIITEPNMHIRYIFTDWSAMQARQDKRYPKSRVMSQTLPLMSMHETEQFITRKLNTVAKLMGATQDQLPLCTDEELWKKPDLFKYYKDPTKKTRSTKNFDTAAEAYNRLEDDGNVGEVIKVDGEIVACKYCDVCGICDQAKGYIDAGILNL